LAPGDWMNVLQFMLHKLMAHVLLTNGASFKFSIISRFSDFAELISRKIAFSAN
jgi:hypothetical protein